MNNGGNRFFDGFLLGAVFGGTAVFLFGTRTGRNLVKILSEQGVEGLTNLLEEYDLAGIDEEVEENFDGENRENTAANGETETSQSPKQENRSPKRFFRKIRR